MWRRHGSMWYQIDLSLGEASQRGGLPLSGIRGSGLNGWNGGANRTRNRIRCSVELFLPYRGRRMIQLGDADLAREASSSGRRVTPESSDKGIWAQKRSHILLKRSLAAGSDHSRVHRRSASEHGIVRRWWEGGIEPFPTMAPINVKVLATRPIGRPTISMNCRSRVSRRWPAIALRRNHAAPAKCPDWKRRCSIPQPLDRAVVR